jgi:CubicO group peptidase (beta-lactamase class C family)
MGVLFRAICLFAALVCACRAGGFPADQIETAVRAEIERARIPGLSASVVMNNQLRWSAGFGKADLESDAPAMPSTVYRLASISKSITAVAALQLAERGRLDLDAPVQRYMPDFPEKAWPITPRQLLAHLAGIRHYRDVSEVCSTRHYATLQDALALFQNDPLIAEPGARYLYSTYGYTLLGAVIEAASGRSYPEYVREHIFLPSGMTQARADNSLEIIPGRARGYIRLPDGTLQNSALADTSNKTPGGGLAATVVDLAHFAIALDRGLLLNRRSMDQMFTVQQTRAGGPTGYGLGWYVTRQDGRTEVWHDGAQPQVSTVLSLIPSQGFSVALLANLEGVDLKPLARQIAGLALH